MIHLQKNENAIKYFFKYENYKAFNSLFVTWNNIKPKTLFIILFIYVFKWFQLDQKYRRLLSIMGM